MNLSIAKYIADNLWDRSFSPTFSQLNAALAKLESTRSAQKSGRSHTRLNDRLDNLREAIADRLGCDDGQGPRSGYDF